MGRLLQTGLAIGRLYQGIKGLWALIGALVSGSWAAGMIAYFGGPWPLVFAGTALTVILIICIYVYVGMPSSPGNHTPRYLKWYAIPCRKISWDFDNYLGLSASDGKNLTVYVMQFNLRVNYGADILPIEGHIASLSTGEKVEITLRGPKGYLPVSAIEKIPAKSRIHAHATFPGAPLKVADFLRRFSGFDFRFEHNNGKFERRFTRAEVEFVIDTFRRYTNPEPPRQIVAKEK